MKLITDFYQSLDTLNLIIFWGIIIVIILLIIFSYLLINKNKKQKKVIEVTSTKNEEDLPIKNEIEEEINIIDSQSKNIGTEQINTSKTIETETSFVAEEHIINYNNESKDTSPEEISTIKETTKKTLIEMPTGPYQRNVLREMSLSQTSPIGINRYDNQKDKKIEMAKDLEQSLNNKSIDASFNIIKEPEQQGNKEVNIQVKEELQEHKNNDIDRKTEIAESHPVTSKTYNIETPAKELLDIPNIESDESKDKSSSEIYLEEVSKKLAEAEVPDDIERTNYELQQEEDAIISYTELMSKKDSIQTIDEEDAVISIEELMNRNQQNTQEQTEDEASSKLYNLTEEEENDDFIKELKQFRNDL